MPTRPRTINQRFDQSAAAALRDFVELQIGDEIVLLGRCIAVGLPRELCRSEAARTFLRQVSAAPAAMSKLRRFWSQYRSSQETARAPDHDLLRAVGGALETGELKAIVFRRASRSPVIDGRPGTQGLRPTRLAASVAGATSTGIAPVAPPSSGSASPTRLQERVAEVIRRAIPKVPSDAGQALLSLLTMENLAIIVGTIGFVAAANLTPYGWAADAILISVAYYYGGLMEIHVLGDLVECFKLTSGAKSDQDLNAAADALARAVVALGVVGLMAVLHRVKERAGTGSGSAANAEEVAPGRGTTQRTTGAQGKSPSSAQGGETPVADEVPKPKISEQKQAGHVEGTPQYKNRVKQGKPTSTFDGDANTAEKLSLEAWAKGKGVPGRPGVKDYDFGRPIGTGPKGGKQTTVRVHQDAEGRIHGHPVGPEQ
jgi:hypothetical protein